MNWQAKLGTLEKKCTWFIGDDMNSYTLWYMQPGKFVNLIDNIENYDLFDDIDDFKSIFSKDFAKRYEKFLENSNREYWNRKLFIYSTIDNAKSITKIAQKHEDDLIIINDLSKSDLISLFEFFIKKYDMQFNLAEIDFIKKNIPDLRYLNVCNLLKIANIDLNEWSEFLPESEISWYKYLKEGKLLQQGIINSQKIIPIMQYMIRADSNITNKGILEFLMAVIKDGAKIYEYNNLWKQLL